MKFVCERCHTKYSIADEKVRGKVLKVRCKTCTNVITVRETGATIDDIASDAPRDAPISRSGSFDADSGDGDTVVAPRGAHLGHAAAKSAGKLGGLPVAALFSPSAPIAAPPVKRAAPPAPPPEMDWYLAIDGAQTGPFSRGRLVDKILGAAKEADVHVWNADFDGWKPPQDVAELQAELARRRRTGTPVPPPPRRASGAAASLTAAAAAGAPAAIAKDGGLASAGMDPGLDSGVGKLTPPVAHKPTGAPPKKNGVGGGGATASSRGIALGDLLGSDTGATPAPAAGLAAARASGALDAAAMLTPPLATASATGIQVPVAVAPAAARGGKGSQVKLLLGGLAVVLVLIGLVSIWMLRRPAAVVAVGEPGPARPAATDFAGMAEKLAQEEAAAANKPAADKGPATAPPAPIVETKPVIARLEPPQKNSKGKKGGRKNLTAPPPLSPTSGGAGLTAEQRDAANRFGDSTGRELRLPSAGGGGARTTPAQADISRVINNNRQGIQTCYQRALLRDNTLTHGKVTVRVSVGLSGRVKSVNLDAPAQFRALEPCIRDVMSRWAFPPSSEEYGTEFPVVLQGNQ